MLMISVEERDDSLNQYRAVPEKESFVNGIYYANKVRH